MLRYELQKNKKTINDLCQEKINEREKIKCEYLSKITEMEKKLKAQQSEIEFKNIEIMQSRTKRNETLRSSMLDRLGIPHEEATHKKYTESEISSLFDLGIQTNFNKSQTHKTIELPASINEKENNNTADLDKTKHFQYLSTNCISDRTAFEELRAILFQLHSKIECNISTADCDKILAIASYAVKRMVDKIDAKQTIDTQEKIEHKFNCVLLKKMQQHYLHTSNIYQANRMFNNEKIHLVRRILSCLVLCCSISTKVYDLLLTSGFLKDISGAIMQFGYTVSLNTLLYFRL